jgi:tetratricopeptide (TPR) repeat protein
MTKPLINSTLSKSKAFVLLEYVLLALCLCVIALRATFTEGPTMRPSTTPDSLGDSLYSLSVSAVLIFSFVFWLILSFCSKRFLYRLTGIEVGLGLFCAAAAVAGFAASDKRLAITAAAVLLAPPLAAVLLVQILDSPSKIKLVLAVIAALGVVSTYQCAEQLFVSNQVTIEEYEKSPQTFLEPLGIEPGTFQQFLFEHRLYTKGVHGFFTTSNSAGSFSLMASFAAIALFIDKLKNRKSGASQPIHILASGIAVVLVIFGLALTRSKGAIIGALFAAAILTALLCFGNWLITHKKAILTVCIFLSIVATGAVISYGLKHGRLPGGSSMLVRWQYWQASAKMFADHSLTGVGPGNFATFYTRYKPAAALESVADPHNFPLSILTQYGTLGLIGFLAMIFIPLWKALSPAAASPLPRIDQPQPTFKTLALALLIIISLALLLVRPLLMPPPPADNIDVVIYLIVTLYITPAAVFIIAFLLLTAPLTTTRATSHDSRTTIHEPLPAIALLYKAEAGRVTALTAALFSAIAGVCLHNLIDFAIFEPPVLTAFWALMACLIAADSYHNSRPQLVLKLNPLVKILLMTAGIITIWAYLYFALIPVARTTAKIKQANRAISAGQFDYAHQWLDIAAIDDRLSPIPLSLNARLYLHHFEVTQSKLSDLLLQAEKCLQTAINRNDADFKNFERLADTYNRLAEISTPSQKTDWLNKAFDIAKLAIERYPGCERLHFELAKIAEQLGKTGLAHQEYEKTIKIEDSFRSQFKLMYPNREIVSRLGEDKYQFATERIKALKKQQK